MAQFAVVAGMFHLFTHAFFKALLFLASGSVMHAMGGRDRHEASSAASASGCPITHWTFAIGALALSGILPIFAGFWSKDEVLTSLKRPPRLRTPPAAPAGAGLIRRLLGGDPHRLHDRLLHRPGLSS